MPELQVTTEDIQAVMQANPAMAMQVENHALRRAMGQLQIEIEQLKQELANTKTENGASLGQSAKKEKLNADSRA